jgi:alkaline phosphatase D
MSRKDADFMLWLGDNWYLSDDECTTPEGLWGKAHYARTVKTLQPLLTRKMPAYAIWDDHDYGPNQSQKNFPLKQVSRDIFMDTWKDNPTYGENGEGIYTSFRKNDVEFILLDDRWWRDYDRLWDYKWFKRNRDKRMFGQQQMDWLKKKLLEDTTASFKIIVNGSQMLNPWAKDDCFIHFPIEYYDLLDFIAANRINGVIFLSGDRHYSEIIRLPREDHYPLYDVTVSPFTSTPDPVKGREKHNIYRVPGSYIPTYNFARYTVSGDEANRKLKVEFFDKYGKLLNEWQVMSSELRDE